MSALEQCATDESLGWGCRSVCALVNVSRCLKLEGTMVLIASLSEGGDRSQICAFIHTCIKLARALSWWTHIYLTTKRADMSNIAPFASNPDDRNTPVTVRDHVVEEQTVIECPGS
jgi:hypothetical protein